MELVEQIEIEYVLEKAELVKGMDEEFRKIFEKFTFTDAIALEVILCLNCLIITSSLYIFGVNRYFGPCLCSHFAH